MNMVMNLQVLAPCSLLAVKILQATAFHFAIKTKCFIGNTIVIIHHNVPIICGDTVQAEYENMIS
jgi:serine acetyltransferase